MALGEGPEVKWNKLDLYVTTVGGVASAASVPPPSSQQHQGGLGGGGGPSHGPPMPPPPPPGGHQGGSPKMHMMEHRDRVNSQKYETIDSTAMYLFPIIFFLVNVCYWSYYLLFFETVQMLW